MIQLSVNRERCVGCAQCTLMCDQGALYTEWGVVEVDQDLCILCGVCTEYCPVGALEIEG